MAVQNTPVALALAMLLCTSAVGANAATITYDVTNTSGNTWRYDYTVTNDTLGSDLFEFTVLFDYTLFENLAVDASPADWDSLVAQPDANIPDDGFFDSLNLTTGLPPDATQSGFSVLFDFLGSGSPGAQPFNIVDPDTFETIESGTTVSAVPLPAPVWLFSAAIGALLSVRRQSQSMSPREAA